jgi:hypothetical protein
MTGNSGSDTFVFTSFSEAGSDGSRDIITDFQKGVGKIDLSIMDANGSASGNLALHFQEPENALFDRKAGALAWHLEDNGGTSNDKTVIQGDLNGDGRHDFEIELKGLIHLRARV